jgi:hypothetical protein
MNSITINASKVCLCSWLNIFWGPFVYDKDIFWPKSARETLAYFVFLIMQTCLNSLPRGVEPRSARCHSGALATRLETLWHMTRILYTILEILVCRSASFSSLYYFVVSGMSKGSNTFFPKSLIHDTLNPWIKLVSYMYCTIQHLCLTFMSVHLSTHFTQICGCMGTQRFS